MLRVCFLNHCFTFSRARADFTNPKSGFSQSWLGPRGILETNISTVSPLERAESSGTSFPLTLDPIQELPSSVWILYAKSTEVEPVANSMILPLGVYTKT